jgi:hypothetical protein
MDSQSKSPRRYDLDWLRIIGISAVFLYHCVSIFLIWPWLVPENEASSIFAYPFFFFLLWMMPILFTISGRAFYYSIQKYEIRKFLKKRAYRLMIPFLFGIIFLSSVIVYLQRISEGVFIGSFLDFYPIEYFRGFYGFGGNFSIIGFHLWYLLLLFIFTLLAIYPAKYLLKRKEKENFDNFKFLQKPGAILLLSIPVILTTILADFEPTFIGRTEIGGWSFLTYAVFFVYGFIFSYDERFDKIINKNWQLSGVLVIIFLGILFFLISDLKSFYELSVFIWAPIISFISFTMLIFLFGLFHKKMQKKSNLSQSLNSGGLPFYILHFPVIIIIAYFITRLSYGPFTKLIMISVLSFLITIFSYYFIIKRLNVLRFLFGMKLKK